MAYQDDGEGPKLWVIYDRARGTFWRTGGEGYTCGIADAGLFSESFARQMTGPSYADHHEQARHLSTFRYILNDAAEQHQKLTDRFALLRQLLGEAPSGDGRAAASGDERTGQTTALEALTAKWEAQQAQIRALRDKWLAEVKDRAGAGCGCYGKSTMQRQCANALDTLLSLSPPGAEHKP